MLDWIAGYVARWKGRITSDVQSAIQWGLHAIAGVVYTVFGDVGRAWWGITGTADGLINRADQFTAAVFGWIRQIVVTDLPWVWHSLLSGLQGVETLIGRWVATIEGWIASAVRYAEGLVSSAIQWVITNVWDPLKRYADQLYSDLLKWGYWSWQLLNDPARLAVLLLDWLIAAAEAAFWRIAAPAGRFLLGVLLHQADKLAALLESIISAVL